MCRTSHHGNEECQTNTHGRDEGILTLLGSKHQHHEDQLSCHEHLDEDSLRNAGSGRERGVGQRDVTGKHALH